MRVRVAYLIVLGLAGLLACNAEQAAEKLSTDNTPPAPNPTPLPPPPPPPPTPAPPPAPENVYSRMFPELPPFAPPTDEAREQAKQLGVRGGLLDALDNQPRPNNPDNPNMTKGVTFFGQFLDHDLTFALRAPLLEPTDPRRTTNFRTSKFDLDSLYGNGPEGSPELYETNSGDIKFRIEAIPGSEQVSKNGAVRFDLPRDPDNHAIIPDPRNDENVVISQFHLAMLRFHNAVVDRLRSDPAQANRSAREIFGEARRLVTWHYQWIILHEFLPLTIGQERVDDIVQNGPRFYRPLDRTQDALFRNSRGDLLIPVEFAVAAYRFGHSQVRPSYLLNFGPDAGAPLILSLFDDSANPNDPDPNDLRGGKRAPRRFVDWQSFFKFDTVNFGPNKKIDTKLSSPLMQLPGARGPAPGLPADGVQSLASRNLMRHVNFGIPSGQAIARVMGVPVLTAEQLVELTPFNMHQSTPLWYYILKEAEVLENGLRLGPVGSRIVGEVFIGLLQADTSSFLVVDRNFQPTLPSATPGKFEITDLLNFAGVVHPLN
jgi:hypothetical protein